MKNLVLITSLVMITSAAQAVDVKVATNNGNGSISGVVNSQNKFRITDIYEVGPRDVKISGDLFKGQSTAEILSDCEDVYGISPGILKKEKKSVSLLMTLFPYTKEGLSKSLGVEAETAPSVVNLTPVLRLGSKTYTRRVYPTVDSESLTEILFGKDKVSQEKVAKGEEVKVDLTGHGALVCDILMGKAELSWKVQVSFPQPMPQVFTPLTAEEIQVLSKVLLTRFEFKGDVTKNLISLAVVVDNELKALKKPQIDLLSDDAKSLSWTRGTFENLVQGLTDLNTGKPVFMTAEKATTLSETLKVSAYKYEYRELLLNAKLVGAK